MKTLRSILCVLFVFSACSPNTSKTDEPVSSATAREPRVPTPTPVVPVPVRDPSQVLDKEAKQRADEYWNSRISKCGDSHFSVVNAGTRYFDEFKGLTIRTVKEPPLTQA